jgi:hypothetical protein
MWCRQVKARSSPINLCSNRTHSLNFFSAILSLFKASCAAAGNFGHANNWLLACYQYRKSIMFFADFFINHHFAVAEMIKLKKFHCTQNGKIMQRNLY